MIKSLFQTPSRKWFKFDMPVRADAPLRKITLNLYEADATAMEAYYGHGWTEVIRRLVYEHINQRNPNIRRTLEDIADEYTGAIDDE